MGQAGYKKGASRQVEMVFRKHPNAPLPVEQIAGEAGVTREQAISSVSVLRRRLTITSPGMGIYKWESTATEKKEGEKVVAVEMMEVLGATKKGGWLCRGDDGRIYIAEEADL